MFVPSNFVNKEEEVVDTTNNSTQAKSYIYMPAVAVIWRRFGRFGVATERVDSGSFSKVQRYISCHLLERKLTVPRWERWTIRRSGLRNPMDFRR